MHKKSTTKISIILISIISCFFLFSCTDLNNTNNEEDTPSKEELWASMKGTWICEETTDDRFAYWDYPNIVIDDTEISNSDTSTSYAKCENISTISKMKKLNEVFTWESPKEAIYNTLNLYPTFKDYDLCYYKTYNYDNNVVYSWSRIGSFTAYKIIDDKLHILNYSYSPAVFEGEESIVQHYENIYKRKTSSTDNNNDDDNTETSITESDITGSYTISEANGSTFTFASDGTWNYQYNSSTTDGTWSVSDGELTITYSLGRYSSTAVFTVSVSGDTYTLTGKSGDYITIISSAFKITNQTALENGVVTLVKQ